MDNKDRFRYWSNVLGIVGITIILGFMKGTVVKTIGIIFCCILIALGNISTTKQGKYFTETHGTYDNNYGNFGRKR